TGLLWRLESGQPEENVRLLLGGDTSKQRAVETAARILAVARVPARSVHGILLEPDNRNAPVRHWLEVFDRGRWRAYNLTKGGEPVSEDVLVWWRGPEPLGEVKGGQRFEVVTSVAVNHEEAIRSAIERARFVTPALLEFSLFRLPIQTQSVYRVILLIPLGAFLVVVFRNVVGISTFGTFMPVLIALAFRETQLLWGIGLFSLMVGLGLAFRFYLDRLKLLLVPRLASVLIMVVLLMVLLSVVTNKLGLERALSVALFPMVIMTMTIERMSIVWEERGPGEALKEGMGSLFVASLVYLLMSVRYVEHIMFVFPELLLVLMACTLLLGRYTGYRLVEIYRFKTFREE
ncbi:MAG: 7TM domain-containing protein, partial [Thermodesulfobacteriota bacterium]